MDDTEKNALLERLNQPLPPQSRLKFPTTRLLIFSIGLFLLLCISVIASFFVLEKTQPKRANVSLSPTPTMLRVEPTMLTATEKIYKTTSYGYEIQYAKDTSYTEANTTTYGKTEFLTDCFTIYSVPKENEKTMPKDRNDIAWDQLDDLRNLKTGESKNCSVLVFKFGDDNKASTRNYTKLPGKIIGSTQWDSFSVKHSNKEAANKVFLTNHNNKTYLIGVREDTTSCKKETVDNMLASFTFTN